MAEASANAPLADLLWNLTRNLHEMANGEEDREAQGDLIERTVLIEGLGLDGVGTFPLSQIFRCAARAAYDAWKLTQEATDADR